MFNWFSPICPVDPHAKAWLEERLTWLCNQFGRDVFTRRAIVLPTSDFFPDEYDRSEESVRALLDHVCRYMDTDPDNVDLRLFTNRKAIGLVNERGDYLPNAAGLYERGEFRCLIHLDADQVHDPMLLVGTMAHELAHFRTLGEGRLDRNEFDVELLTDLTVVFHGLGIFLANSPRAWKSQFTTWPGTDVRKPEYMTLPMYGYALAHAAWLRDDQKPDWARYLRLDARACFKQGLRYLSKTGDSSLQ